MEKARPTLSARSLVIIALLGMVALGGGIFFGVNYAVDRAVVVDARDKAQHWADYFLGAMPDLDGLIARGEPTVEQIDIIEAAQKIGDVFRFKLYNTAARQVLVSDDAKKADEGDDVESPDHNDEAAEALETGVPIINISDEHEAGMPPLFVEGYVPIIGDGKSSGVVEVYIDQSGTAELFRTTFAALAVGLAVVAALAFGLPTLAFLFRSRQANEARKKAAFLSQYDTMTGVLNRATFTARLEMTLRKSRADRVKLAIVFFDVDNFKSINDTNGHAAGDELLKHVARALQRPMGSRDLCGRPGGDEFVVLLAGRSADEAAVYIEAVMSAVREPINVNGRTIAGRISGGVYHLERGASAADALHRADVALYQAKTDGRNTYRVFNADMETAMLARRALEARVTEATRSWSFEIYFQPLLHADTQKLAGFEALLRLPDGEGGLISPGVFIPVAETMGLINEIGAWVIREATRIAASWPADLFVAVNLSARQFADGKLIGGVKEALVASGLSPNQLELEVTESMLVENSTMVGAQLKELRELGISIAMDDFGTGYSSLGYLWQFGFDKLKIDRSFISALDEDAAKAREILDTIIVLAHKLGLTVTAEGIETDYHASVLSQLAADHFQGFLYGRPMPATELATVLLKDRLRVTGTRALDDARSA
jgi:diguanylate cyclase (GGDEF)-like protein